MARKQKKETVDEKYIVEVMSILREEYIKSLSWYVLKKEEKADAFIMNFLIEMTKEKIKSQINWY